MARQLAAFTTHPVFEGEHERHHPHLALGMPLGRGQAVDVALDGENRIDPAHRLDRQRRLREIGEHEQLAPTV